MEAGAEFTPEARDSIGLSLAAVRANLRIAASIFTTGDERAARLLAEQKAEFRRRELESSRRISLRCARAMASAKPRPSICCATSNGSTTIWSPPPPILLEASGHLMASRLAEEEP